MLVITHPYLPGKVELERDEIVGLVGRNGSGKTTLINSILCQRHNVFLDDQDFCERKDYSLLSAVFQDPSSQILATTLEDELRLMSHFHHVNFEIGKRLMGPYFSTDFFKLSDGYRKRFVISSVLSYGPEYLLIDEPLSNLDDEGIKLVLGSIPKGSLISEHRTKHLLNLVQRVYLLSGDVREVDKEKLEDQEFLRRNGLRGFQIEYQRGSPGSEILDVQVGLRLKVRGGEVVCLIGKNGVGKTTILRKLSKKIYSVFQNLDLQFFHETVADEVGNDDALSLFGLTELRERSPFTLSLGQKMRVLIASAYASGYKVIGLDEPTTAMDGDGLQNFVKMVELLREERRGLILATHDKDVIPICDQIISLS
ncbi:MULTISPECIES: ATP-binding cassette domain-containing protein [Metallosphaera]|uniref:ATP-binding cassette domain-containing protein n=1 Tax=Metallosphaera TaxID=41980 RepID=UPI002989B360|nr:ATP-binding cassette domain-containing protein [Metallosphaera sedula]MCP6729294.1 ATP-binding cassette domain-containing protein [Metallosphaera sedula]